MRCVLLTRTQRHTLLQIGSKDLISTCPAGFWPCKLFAKCAISNQFGKFCPTQIWQMVRPGGECLASASLGWGLREASSNHNMHIPQITTPLEHKYVRCSVAFQFSIAIQVYADALLPTTGYIGGKLVLGPDHWFGCVDLFVPFQLRSTHHPSQPLLSVTVIAGNVQLENSSELCVDC